MQNKLQNWRLEISISSQKLRLWQTEQCVSEYSISTSSFGIGTEPGSYRTPLGRFQVFQKIGEGAPLFTVFRSRQSTGELAELGGSEDGILTRIFWLEGLDAENANTKERYIYIHGTNQEALLGTPASHGCVRMKNSDIVELFAKVPEGTLVEIKEA